MRPVAWRSILVLFTVLVLVTACISGGEGEGTPPASPEPADNRVVFSAPYLAVLDEGETVEGAELQYLNKDDDGINVRIEGQEARRKVGDSFNWQGSPAEGVELDYKLRVLGVYVDVFQAWGWVDIVVLDPNPVEGELPDEAPLTYSAAVASYEVGIGEVVPGTTYSYLGKTDKGAEFGGLEGYAYREIADSLDWSGQLRENVYVDLTMRVRSIDDDEVKLLGTATVWIFP
jgi:hypothetical protein